MATLSRREMGKKRFFIILVYHDYLSDYSSSALQYIILNMCMEGMVSQNVDEGQTFGFMNCRTLNFKKVQKVSHFLS